MKDIDFSRENLDHIMGEYEPLLCYGCKEKLKLAAEPIKDRLNLGKPPKLRHMQKLIKVLCPLCMLAINKKNIGARQK